MFIMVAINISPAACRAARAILRWSLDDLSERVGITRDSLSRFEVGVTGPMRASNQSKLIAAFADAGVEVLAPPADGARRTPPEE